MQSGNSASCPYGLKAIQNRLTKRGELSEVDGSLPARLGALRGCCGAATAERWPPLSLV
jgi:hypothetical protein